MKLAVSSIAWDVEDEHVIRQLLHDIGVVGVELAPTQYWADLTRLRGPTPGDVRERWVAHGLDVVACQALLYGQPGLQLFEPTSGFETYLRGAISVGAALGATNLVFGAPRNRLLGELDASHAWGTATEVFRRLAAWAADSATRLVIEANPPEYGADWLTTVAEAADFVRAVESPGLGLHIDTACMYLVGEDPTVVIPPNADIIRHVHLSNRELGAVGRGAEVPIGPTLEVLQAVGYTGWVSIEMRNRGHGGLLEAVEHVQREFDRIGVTRG